VFEKEEVIDKEIVKRALQEKVLVTIVNNIPEEALILQQDIKYTEEENSIWIDMIVEALEEIGKEEKI
ncbi:MAG: hypothetical protein AB2421_09285, partial [Thermotaleaceae bacterium]